MDTAKALTSLTHKEDGSERTSQKNIHDMEQYLNRLGYKVSDLSRLNILHVTGTKGKGSTGAFCESILRRHGYTTGLFSSPHIVRLTDRFLYNGKPIEQQNFVEYFWKIYNKLSASMGYEGDFPHCFSFLTLMCFDMFLDRGVDALVLEVGIGGQNDCTNVIKTPTVCGVTTLELDHVNLLGSSIESIAWHKAGIFKPCVPAITVRQEEPAMEILKNRALEIGAPLSIAPPLSEYGSKPIALGIFGPKQNINASLALQMCKTWLDKQMGHWPIPGSVVAPRSSVAQGSATTWTLPTLQVVYRGRTARVLIYFGNHDRAVGRHLSILKQVHFDAVIFSPYTWTLEADQEETIDSIYQVDTKENQIVTSVTSKHLWDDGTARMADMSDSARAAVSFVSTSLREALLAANQGKDTEILGMGVDGHQSELSDAHMIQAAGLSSGNRQASSTELSVEGEPTSGLAKLMPRQVQDADHIHILITGGFKVVGQTILHLNKC